MDLLDLSGSKEAEAAGKSGDPRGGGLRPGLARPAPFSLMNGAEGGLVLGGGLAPACEATEDAKSPNEAEIALKYLVS